MRPASGWRWTWRLFAVVAIFAFGFESLRANALANVLAIPGTSEAMENACTIHPKDKLHVLYLATTEPLLGDFGATYSIY